MSENENWFQAEKPEGVVVDAAEVSRFYSTVAGIDWVHVPDTMITKSNTKRWGAIAGGYVRAAIWRDMVELDKMQSPNAFDWLMREWKQNKTSRSPTVHFNNTVGNLILSELYDFTAQDIVRGMTEFAARGPMYEEAVRNGVFGSSYIAIEINGNNMAQVIDDVIREVEGLRGQRALEHAPRVRPVQAHGPQDARCLPLGRRDFPADLVHEGSGQWDRGGRSRAERD